MSCGFSGSFPYFYVHCLISVFVSIGSAMYDHNDDDDDGCI